MGRMRVGGGGIIAGADRQRLAIRREGHRVDRAPLCRIDLRHDLAIEVDDDRVSAPRGERP